MVQECYDYILTDAGKERVLNPLNRTPISKVNLGSTDFEKEIEARVDLYVGNFVQIGEVFKRYECIQIEINTFYDQVMADLSGMEKEWIEALPDTWEFSQTDVLVSLGVLSFGFGLTAAVFAGVALIVGTVWGWSTVKTDEDIDYKYNKHKTKIRRKICN